MNEKMSMLNDPAVLREVIMDHYQYPRNHELTKDEGYRSVHMASDSCIDDITVQSKISGDIVEDIRFDGVACTIATASTSIMTGTLMSSSSPFVTWKEFSLQNRMNFRTAFRTFPSRGFFQLFPCMDSLT